MNRITRIAPLPGSRCALGGAPTSFVEELAVLRDMPRKRAPEPTYGQALASKTRAQAVAKAMAALDKAFTAALPTPEPPADALDAEVRIDVGPLTAVCPCAICADIRERARQRIAARKDDLWNIVLGGRTLTGIVEQQFARGGVVPPRTAAAVLAEANATRVRLGLPPMVSDGAGGLVSKWEDGTEQRMRFDMGLGVPMLDPAAVVKVQS